MDELHEVEQAWHTEYHPSRNEQEEHKETHRASDHDASQSETSVEHRSYAQEAVLLVARAVCDANAEQQDLLQDEH